jgi:hypothetical protein
MDLMEFSVFRDSAVGIQNPTTVITFTPRSLGLGDGYYHTAKILSPLDVPGSQTPLAVNITVEFMAFDIFHF